MTKRRARQPAAPLGIHRDLWPYTLVAFLVGLLVAALGIGLLAALTFPGLRIRFDVGGAGRVALYAAGVVWTLFGLYAVLITPAYLRHKTHVFLFASPEPAEISLSVHESMDDRELLVVVGGERYVLFQPRWDVGPLLDASQSALVYRDAEGRLATLEIREGLLWSFTSRGQ